LSQYREAGLVERVREIRSEWSGRFASDVLRRLGYPTDLSAIEYFDLTGPPGAGQGDEVFQDGTLSQLGVKIPPGVTADLLNATGLGLFGIYKLLRWESPSGPSFFDAETPHGVESPFSLPFAQRQLRDARKKRIIANVIRYANGKPTIEVPADWTREKDTTEYMTFMEASAYRFDNEDRCYQAAVNEFWEHRSHLEGFLEDRLGVFGQFAELVTEQVWDVVKSCMTPKSKVDLLKVALQKRFLGGSLFTRIETGIGRVKDAFDLADDTMSRWVPGREAWLIELAAVSNNLDAAALRLAYLLDALVEEQLRLAARWTAPAVPTSQ